MPVNFTGSLAISGSLVLTGSISTTGTITISGSILSASYASNAELLDNLDSTSFVYTSSFNTYSSSMSTRVTNLESTSSVLTTASASFTQQSGSNSIRFTNLESTASVLTTASASFSIVSSSYASTSGSLSTRVTNTESTGSSLVIASGSFAQQSGSNSVRLTNLESTASVLTTASSSFSVVSSSFATTSGSMSLRITNIEGNYATTGSNIFTGAQTVCANITSTGTIIAQTINVQQVTSSIVYSSGSNIFGNLSSDIQQMTGSLRITGSLNTVGNACVTSICSPTFIGGTVSGTTVYGSTVVCSPSVLSSGTICSTGNTCFGGMSIIASCVGIGTATPIGKLDVTLLNTRRFIVTYDDSIITIKGASDTGAGENLRVIGDNLIFNTNSVGSGTERLRITSTGIACFACQVCAAGNVLVGGTGTTNYISKFTGASAIGDSNVQDNGTVVTITSNTAGNSTLNLISSNSVNSGKIQFGGATYGATIEKNSLGADTALIFNSYHGGAEGYTFKSNGSNILTITGAGVACFACTVCAPMVLASGCVGIGTTSPQSQLHIYNSGGTATLRLHGTRTADGSVGVVNFSNITDITGGYIIGSIGVDRSGFDNGGAMIFSTATAASTPTERMRITSGGNVLIGTSTDRSFKLVVEGTDNNNLMGSYNTTSGASLRMQSNQTVNYIVSATNPLQFEVGAAIRMAITSTGIACFACQVCSAGAVLTGDLTLSSGGDRIFSINDTGGNLFQIQAASNVLYYSARSTGGSLAFRTNGSNDTKFSIASTGIACFACQVCSGNGFYASSLQSGITIDSTTNGDTIIAARGLSTALHGIVRTVGQNGVTCMQIISTRDSVDGNLPASVNALWGLTNHAMVIATCDIERMRITSGGLVGINTPTPVAPLQVVCTPGSFYGIIETTACTAGTAKHFRVHKPGCVEYGIGILDNNSFHISTASTFPTTNGFTLTSAGIACFACQVCAPAAIFTGCVGIGTTSPSAKLHVVGTGPDLGPGINVPNIFVSGASGFQSIGFRRDSDSNGGWFIGTSHSVIGDFGIYQNQGASNPSNRLSISTSGNVGIGTSSPTEKLDVRGWVYNYGTQNASGFKHENAGGGHVVILNANDSYAQLYTTGATALMLGTNNTERMRITSVGITCFAGTVCAPCFATISDYRMKSNLRPIEGLSIIMNTKPYKFEYNYDCSTSFGVIAHELQEVLPEAVFGEKDGEVMQGVDYMKLLPIAIKAIQEQQYEIKQLKTCLGIL